MKPIETRYNGRLFRSRLEARWAVLLDAVWLRWEYEVEGFVLPSGPYLPDFFLRLSESPYPGAGYWVEIKPRLVPSERDGVLGSIRRRMEAESRAQPRPEGTESA